MSRYGVMRTFVLSASMRLQLGVDGAIKRRCILPRDRLRRSAGMLRLHTAARAAPPHDPNEVRGRLDAGTPDVAARIVRRFHDDLRRDADRPAAHHEAPVGSRPHRPGDRPLALREDKVRSATTSSSGAAILGVAASFLTTLRAEAHRPKGSPRQDPSPRLRRSPGFASIMQRAHAQGGTSAPTSTSSPVPLPRARMSPLLRPLSLSRVQGRLTARRPPLRIFDRGGPQPSGFVTAPRSEDFASACVASFDVACPSVVRKQ